MKKYYYLIAATLMMGTMTFVSCNDDDNTPTEQTAVLDFENDKFTALIDNPQYNGPLLYQADSYQWEDNGNSNLSCSFSLNGSWGKGWFYGGIAISNYIDADETHNSFTYQLSVPKGNGSNNFAIVQAGSADNQAILKFSDSKAHVIKSMQVMNTTYALYASWGGIKQGLKDGYKFAVTVKADNGASKEIVLAENKTAIENWTNVDLSSLGAVKTLTFTFSGTDAGDYGLNTPAYVAIDNIVVVK